MRRALSSFVTVAVGAAVLVLPASAARAIDPPTVRVSPGVSSVVAGASRQLTATVANVTDTSVTWSVLRGPGSVSATGLYTPPAEPPAEPVAVVRAESVEAPGVVGDAVVHIASGVPGGAFGAELPTGHDGGQDTDIADVTGDGVPDVVVLENCCNVLSTWRFVTLSWNGSGFTKSATGYANTKAADGFTNTNDYVLDLELGDVDEDGDVDIYVPFGSAQAQTWRYQVWRNNGTGTFTPDARVPTTGGARSGARARLVDFDGDGHLDAVRQEYYGTFLLETGNGNGTFDAPVQLMHVSNAHSFSLGDLTGDGRPELAVGIKTTQNVTQDVFKVGINNGFGSIANEVTYTTGVDAEPYIAEVTGDGWNDLVVAVGGESFSNPANSPKLVVFPNLGTGTGAAATTSTLAASFRPSDLQAVHLDEDGVLDLAGGTSRGPAMLRRTGVATFSQLHAASLPLTPHHTTVGDVTGDGRPDAFVNGDDASRFWPGSADPTLAFAIDPTVSHVNATLTAGFSASMRNVTAEPKLTWTASRGTFSGDFFDKSTYTAPSSASPTGTPVTITATLNGTSTRATRTISVVNERFQGPSPVAQSTRQVVTDPASANTLYAATAGGVFRSTNGGASFALLGTTGTTGTDAKALTLVRDGSTARLLAVFGTTLYKYDLTTVTDWVSTGVTSAAAVSAAPGTSVVYATSGGAVRASTDGGDTFSALTGTSNTVVNRLEAIDGTSFWATRTSAPYVVSGVVSGTAVTVTSRETPAALPVNALAVDPDDRTVAYTAPNDAKNPLFRWDAGTWAALSPPHVVDRLSVSPTGTLLAVNTGGVPDWGGNAIYKSVNGGASWYSLNRGFPNGTSLTAVAHRTDGLPLAGTSGGIYTPVEQVPPAAPEVTGGPSGTTPPGGANAFSFTFGTVADASSYLCALDDAAWAACTSPKTYSGPLSDGSHTFSVVAADANGNESAPGTRTWSVDATPAPVPVITAGPTGVVNSATAAFEFTLSGDAVGATCALDNATPASCTSGKSYSSLSQGAHTFYVRSLDAAGNASAAASRAWSVDTVAPTWPSFWQTPQWTSPSSSAFFQWSTDASATYTCTLDGSQVACSSSAASLTGLSEGSHTFTVTATDAAGNSAANQYTWTVDLTNPEPPVITAKPAATTSATSASFTFASSSNDVSYYLCQLDSGSAFSCYGSQDYVNLAVGNHTFAVKAMDQAGRQSAGTTYQWTVEVGAPSITGGPTGLVNTRTAAFTFTGLNGATFACSLDGATPSSCASGVTYPDLGDGAHTFAVTQTVNGSTSPAATRAWTVDATAPASPELTAVPPLRTKSTTATFAWTPDGALTYTCALDGSPVTCGTGGYTASALAQGSHTFVLTARDAAQNLSTSSYTWSVDTTGPTVSISTKPADRVASTSAAFEFGSAASDLAGYTCTLDGVASACTSPRNLSSLAQGAHTFSVIATDDLGNAGNTATHTWTVDTTGPAVTLTDKPGLRTTAQTASFGWTTAATDVASYACTLDGVTAPCTAPHALASLGEGLHTFSVVGTDDLGNTGPPASHTWTVDRTGPVVALTTTPALSSAARTPTFEWTSSSTDVASYACTLDGVTTACTSPRQVASLGDGEHTFSVVGTDDLGNAGGAAAHTWTVDTTGPVVTITTAPDPREASTSATFDWMIDGGGPTHHFECTVDGTTYWCASGVDLSSLADGEHSFSVLAVDMLGNAGAADSHTWIVDTTGPVVTFSETPTVRTSDPSATFDWGTTATDVASYACTLDGVTDDCDALGLSSLSEGQHTFSVVATDDLGNAGDPASHTWTVDTTAPAVALTATPPALTNATSASFSFSSNATDVDGFTCALDGTESPCTSPFVVPVVGAGAHTFSVAGTDDVGNAGEAATFAWTVDTAAPGTTIATPSTVLNPSHVVSWNEPVTNVTASTVRLLLTGTTTAVPAALTCRTAVNAPVSCASGTTRNVLVVPAAPLTPGQTYSISVSGVRDLAGNAATGSRAYRASTSEQENGLAAKPSWRKVAWSGAQGGSFQVAHVRNATASYTFTGTSVTWYGVRGPAYGTADVYVDNVLKASKVNFYSTGTGALTRTISGLSNAKHTLRIVVRGERGSTYGKGTDIAVDAFKVGTALAATPPVTFAWARNAASAASGGAYMVEDYAGATFTMSFRGRTIDWVTMLGPNMGKATVHIDGVGKGTFDNWASATKYGAVRRFGGLTDKVHTITITVLGQRRTGATGANVVVDRFAITP